jgi:hypothetical protein
MMAGGNFFNFLLANLALDLESSLPLRSPKSAKRVYNELPREQLVYEYFDG